MARFLVCYKAMQKNSVAHHTLPTSFGYGAHGRVQTICMISCVTQVTNQHSVVITRLPANIIYKLAA